MHTRHLAFLRDGLLLTDLQLATLVKDIMDTCKRFAGLVDRWGGDGISDLASGAEEILEERSKQMKEVGRVSYAILSMEPSAADIA
jgi:gamma-tubulin complex component 4